MSKLFSTPKSKAMLSTLVSISIFALVLFLFMWLTITLPIVSLGLLLSILALFFIKQVYDKFLEEYEEEQDEFREDLD